MSSVTGAGDAADGRSVRDASSTVRRISWLRRRSCACWLSAYASASRPRGSPSTSVVLSVDGGWPVCATWPTAAIWAFSSVSAVVQGLTGVVPPPPPDPPPLLPPLLLPPPPPPQAAARNPI